ncbi:MAG: CBS domain-containing protein [Alphaproteobacteria bacterium]
MQKQRKTIVRDVMEPSFESVALDDTLDAAADKMKDRNVDALAVLEGDKLVGVLTVSDLHARAGGDAAALDALVRDVVSLAVNFCLENHTIEQAAAIMDGGRVHRLPVVASDHTMVGIVSLRDLARQCLVEASPS